MLCLGSRSQPAWGLMGHIIGARIGPRQLLLLRPLLLALIPPPQIIWTHCWPGKCKPIFTHDGDFPSNSPIFRGGRVKRRILTKYRLYTWYVWTRQQSKLILKGWFFCQWTASRNFYAILLTMQLSHVKPPVWLDGYGMMDLFDFCGSCAKSALIPFLSRCSTLQWRLECGWQRPLHIQRVPEGYRQGWLHSDPRRCERSGGEDVAHLG